MIDVIRQMIGVVMQMIGGNPPMIDGTSFLLKIELVYFQTVCQFVLSVTFRFVVIVLNVDSSLPMYCQCN